MKKLNYNFKGLWIFLFVCLLTITNFSINYTIRAEAENENRQNFSNDYLLKSFSPERETSPTVSVGKSGSPMLKFLDGKQIGTTFYGGEQTISALRNNLATPSALVTADFDDDGFPDLVTGYAVPGNGGILTFQRANPEAFAPHSEESFATIKEGRFPDPFLEKAESYNIPVAPDFLVKGDFDRDGNPDVIAAARSDNKMYLFSGKGKDDGGGFYEAREIDLPGQITVINNGGIEATDIRADLLIGLQSETGAVLLVFENSERSVFGSPLSFSLTTPAVSLEAGQLDDDNFIDTAILTGDGVYILHGHNPNLSKKAGYELERINLPFVPQAIALGEFIYDRAGKTEMALLNADGTVQIAKRGELDERPFSIEESRANRRRAAERSSRGEVNTDPTTRQISAFENWTLAVSVRVAVPDGERNTVAPILMKANLSGQNTDDILFLDAAANEVKILYTQEPEKVNGEAVSFAGRRAVYSLETANQPTAMLSMPLNIFVRPGLVILQNGKTEPAFVPSAPTATFTVDRTDDTNAAAAQACTAAANDCSLRGAITKANGAAGADVIILPAGTYTLTLANSGGNNEDNNATGDLDILDSITITGAGQASTIVQAGTTNANGIDKVFANNPICTSVFNTSFTGLTVRYGRNTQPYNAPDFSFTGGGMDWCNTGASGTLTVTNSTFDQNIAVNGYGGGIDLSTDPNITSGSVSLTGVTLSNNTLGVNLANYGAGLASTGAKYSVTMTNSNVSGNTTPGEGGGIYLAHLGQGTGATDVFQLHGITVSGNSSGKIGGGMDISLTGNQSLTLDQNSTISGNTSGTNSASGNTARGGGIEISALGNSTATITKTTFTGNMLSLNAPSQQGGAGIYADAVSPGIIDISYCRIAGNTGTTAAMGTGLRKGASSGTINAINNFWGCNTGPSAAPCDTATSLGGTLNYTPWLRYTLTANPTPIVVGQGSTLTASFLTNSNNQAIAASDLAALVGVPITFNNAVRGTISNAQATIQATGTATATFTGTSVGAGSANAVVDNGTATATVTIAQATTTTTVTSNANPSVFGQTVTFTATISVTSPGSGTPTGTVQFKDGAATIAGCGAVTLSGGTAQCMTNTLTVGSHTITAVYSGDNNNTGSTSSNLTQTVNKANTMTTINSNTPNPSSQNMAVTVTYSVAVTAPGAGTPTGTVTVSDGVNSCTASVAAGSCMITLTTSGMRTLTATYNGDTNFNTSTSAGVSQTVTPPTAAAVEVNGRVMTNMGRGISGARLTVTDQTGNSRTVKTTSFGYFRFADIAAGETYIISVKAKQYRFAEQVLNVTGDLTDLNFTAQK